MTDNIEQDITEAEEISARITEVISECEHFLEIRKERGDKEKQIKQKTHEKNAVDGVQSPAHV